MVPGAFERGGGVARGGAARRVAARRGGLDAGREAPPVAEGAGEVGGAQTLHAGLVMLSAEQRSETEWSEFTVHLND